MCLFCQPAFVLALSDRSQHPRLYCVKEGRHRAVDPAIADLPAEHPMVPDFPGGIGRQNKWLDSCSPAQITGLAARRASVVEKAPAEIVQQVKDALVAIV